MIEAWLNLFGLLSGAFCCSWSAAGLMTDQWIKERHREQRKCRKLKTMRAGEQNVSGVKRGRMRHAPKASVGTAMNAWTQVLQSAHVISFLIARNIDGCAESATSL